MAERGKGVSNTAKNATDTADARAVESNLEVLDEKNPNTIFKILFCDYIEEKKQ